MTNPDIQQAKEWAKESVYFDDSSGFASAVRVIKSLPDHIIDAEKVRAFLTDWRKGMEISGGNHSLEILNDLEETLFGVPLPTLAELIEQGNDPQQYQWVQCDDDPVYVIMQVGKTVSRVLLSDGNHMVRGNRTITPRPDLPKLEWPGDGVEDATVVDGEPVLPRPEDVPAGEAWLVMNEGCRDQWVGTRDDSGTTNWPWLLVKIDGTDSALSEDADITLVSRMVPEATP